MNKLTLRDIDLKGKKVVMRVDFNVPIKEGVIKDDTRVQGALPSIKYVLEQGGSLVLMSHLGRPDEKGITADTTLKPVAAYLEKLLGKAVVFVDDCAAADAAVAAMKPGDIVTASWVDASGVQDKMEMRYICLYDSNKTLVRGGSDIRASTYVVPSGVYFMRISIYIRFNNTQTLQIEITDDGNYTPYSPYGKISERHLADDIIVPEVKTARGGYDTLGERLDALTAKADWGLNLPPALYALVGEELNVYFDNIITQGRDVDYVWDVTCSIGQQMERGYTVVPTAAGEYAISIKCSKNGMSVQAESKIIVSAANQGSGVTRSMIILGDSTRLRSKLQKISRLIRCRCRCWAQEAPHPEIMKVEADGNFRSITRWQLIRMMTQL